VRLFVVKNYTVCVVLGMHKEEKVVNVYYNVRYYCLKVVNVH